MQKKTIEQIQIRRPWQSDNVCTLALLDIAMLAKKKLKNGSICAIKVKGTSKHRQPHR
jgi:hypothetical protein